MSKLPIRVISAEYVRGYEIRIRFSDGSTKTVDFSRWMRGEVFVPLAPKRRFKEFFVSGGTVSWPNGADIAPETLYAAEDAAAGTA